MKITIDSKVYNYSSQEELYSIFKKYPGIKVGNNFNIGNYSIITSNFTAGDWFTVGDYFTAGDYFKASDYFKAGDRFTASEIFIALHRINPITHIIIPNGYKYIARGYTNVNDGTHYIQLGCYVRTVEEWDKDFWNNTNQFKPNTVEGNKRFSVYNDIKNYLISKGGKP